jgi:hypothetical protein
MEEDPVFRAGFARAELRPFKLSLLRGRHSLTPHAIISLA